MSTIPDYHIHTKASPDAKGSMEEYVRAAKKKNISEIGFSDHILLRQVEGFYGFSVKLMPSYVKELSALRERSELPIKLGVEVDFFPTEIESIREFVHEHPFDYVIGGIHTIGELVIDNPSSIVEHAKRDPSQCYCEYFDLVKQLSRCRLFDVLAHPDLIKIFGMVPKEDFLSVLRDAADEIAKSNICAEINTKGLRRPCKEIFPSSQFLKILYSYNVPITFGSDAHEPREIGYKFRLAAKLAKKAGYTNVCTFDSRERSFVKI